jgi:FdhD protein
MIGTMPRARPSEAVRVVTFDGGARRVREDLTAGEEPLEIRVRAGASSRTVAITMRTPGQDFELAAGFLFAEGVIAGVHDVAEVGYCLEGLPDEQHYNVVSVTLARRELPELGALERHFATTSACGVCGRAVLAALHERGLHPVTAGLKVAPSVVRGLAEALRARQRVFSATGGLHAAALFDANGKLRAVREDVGRHNALDKLLGNALLGGNLPCADCIVLVSGRASYELVQKTIAAGAPVLCAVSAPSSLAVALAREFGITLAGFVRGTRFNVYAHEERIGP